MRGRRSQVLAGVAALLVLMLLPVRGAVATDAETPEQDPAWEAFLDDRTELLNTLAPPFVECFQRRDSLIDPLSPIFHGCLDWHSAVHAAYSHLALFRHTGAYAYLDLVERKIAPHGISLVPAEHAYQIAKDRDPVLGENPYGFGWFLVLARERELSTGKDDLRDMADFAAEQVESWLRGRMEDGTAERYILTATHANYSWSLINLDVWARHTGDEALAARVRELTEPLLDPYLDDVCPAQDDTRDDRPGFQPTCLMRLAALAHVWGAWVSDYIADRVPVGLEVPPVTDPRGCHEGGQNFLRAFALHQLHAVTGDQALRDGYIELIRYHVGRPDLYIGPGYLEQPGYLCYSHWVAQLGVRAIALSYEEPLATPPTGPPLP